MSGLAGMGMATCYIAEEQRVRTLDFVTRVPSQFPAGRFSNREELARSPIAAGAPGNLAGWCELVRSYGRKSLAEVFAPAIVLARDGFPLTEYNVSAISDTVAEFKGRYAFYDDWARNYTSGAAVAVGGVLRQPDLARTYRNDRARRVRDHLYGGALGKALVAHVRALGGCLTLGRSGIRRACLARSVGGDISRHRRPHLAAAVRGISVPADSAHPRRLRRHVDGAQWHRPSRYDVSRHPPRRGNAHRAQQSLG